MPKKSLLFSFFVGRTLLANLAIFVQFQFFIANFFGFAGKIIDCLASRALHF
jgi:hypothetical protein